MKKSIIFLGVALLLILPILVSCTHSSPEENSVENSDENISDEGANIQAIDLNLSENSGYLQYYPNFEGVDEHPIPGNRTIIEDTDTGNLYLKDSSGEKKLLLRGHKEGNMTEWKRISFWEMVDDHRFLFEIVGYEYQCGFGVYDLITEKEHLIENAGDNKGWWPMRIREDKALFASHPYGETLNGLGELDLTTYAFMETDDLASLPDGITITQTGALSPDGSKVAFIGNYPRVDFVKRYILIYSLEEKKVLHSYAIHYLDTVVYHTDKQVYAFAEWEGNNHWLYIIDLP
ncbi:MAG: hypothetical protein FWG14_14000 [Peptococcaceae bacterium]|nr:hypothetical protein [Peptococcaceae bacterium]